uniref:hypothetical protein n=1 Tax=Herbidospora sakaeratensis TaxID=564415 RepID=UPI000785297C|nr:hypothetical protein [Herbidospora sakaeratensis]
MSILQKAANVEVEPEFSLFTVAAMPDVDSASIDHPDGRVTAADDALLVRMRHTSQTAHIRFESWDGPPPSPAGWEELWSGRLTVKSGVVAAADWAEAPDGPEFDLGRAGATWSARLTTRVLLNDREPDFDARIGLAELYRVQFWL